MCSGRPNGCRTGMSPWTCPARAAPELADWLNLLAYPQQSIDSWVWTDHQISSLAVTGGGAGLLAVVELTEVWLIPARDTAIADAAVSIAGVQPAGRGV